jgi:Family of unknown function (DUF6171)
MIDCPICSKPDCLLYAYGRDQYAAGRNHGHWKKIHASLTGEPSPTEPPTATAHAYPPLLTQLSNAALAAGRAISAVATGQPVAVDQIEQDRRLAICHACDLFDVKQGRCTHNKCGCFTTFKSKLATESCPINKW